MSKVGKMGAGSQGVSDMMTAKEVADFLGIGINQLYAGAANDEIPARRIGRRWLFNRAAIVRWLSGNACGMPESE